MSVDLLNLLVSILKSLPAFAWSCLQVKTIIALIDFFLLHFIPYLLQFIAVCLNIIKLLFFSFPGLALDYAAHIGVMYACLKDGTRKQKMRITLGLVD